MAHDVFISYSSADQETAREVLEAPSARSQQVHARKGFGI